MADEVLFCSDCKVEFNFTDGEQKFYAEKMLTKPKRCKACRQARKAPRNAASVADADSFKPALPRVEWTNGADLPSGKRDRRDRRAQRGRRDYED